MEMITSGTEMYGLFVSSGMTKVGFCKERHIKLAIFQCLGKKFEQEDEVSGFVRVDYSSVKGNFTSTFCRCWLIKFNTSNHPNRQYLKTNVTSHPNPTKQEGIFPTHLAIPIFTAKTNHEKINTLSHLRPREPLGICPNTSFQHLSNRRDRLHLNSRQYGCEGEQESKKC